MTDGPPFEEALARLRAALADVANGDVAAIKALYAQTDEDTSFYGWGGYEKGWDQVSRRWDWAGRQFKGGTVRHENLTTVVTRELAYTTDIETFETAMDGMDEPARWVEPGHPRLPPDRRRMAAGPSPCQPPRRPLRARRPSHTEVKP